MKPSLSSSIQAASRALVAASFIIVILALAAPANAATTSLHGNVDGVVVRAGQYVVGGWACVVGQTASINVDLYVGGPPGTGTKIGTYPADTASEPGVGAACQTTGVT